MPLVLGKRSFFLGFTRSLRITWSLLGFPCEFQQSLEWKSYLSFSLRVPCAVSWWWMSLRESGSGAVYRPLLFGDAYFDTLPIWIRSSQDGPRLWAVLLIMIFPVRRDEGWSSVGTAGILWSNLSKMPWISGVEGKGWGTWWAAEKLSYSWWGRGVLVLQGEPES